MSLPLMRAGYRGILCLALIVLITSLPVQAADSQVSAVDSLFPVQQAYLDWMAEVSDVQMVAAISYIETLYGADTGTLVSLHAEFSQAKSAIGTVTSLPALSNQTLRMQKAVLDFNRETINQTNAHAGKMADLQAQTGRSVNSNPYIAMKKDAYWTTRGTHQLADFDAWVIQAQKVLVTLQAQGFAITDTQPYLDRFASLKTDLKSSLDSKDFDRVDATALRIKDRSTEITRRIATLPGQVSLDTTAAFRIDEADRVIGRAGRINKQLVEQILDIGAADPALYNLKADVKMAHGAQNSGQTGLVVTQLTLIKKDYRDLAAAYRDIAVSSALPEGMADILISTSITLDAASDRIGES
ncbi:MAG: hypothetical protein WCH85_02615 [Methanomicrobiales archaeon]